MESKIILYFGDIVIVAWIVYLVIERFKDEDSINLSEHKWIIFLYILIMLSTLFTWKIIYELIITSISNDLTYDQIIQSIFNG
ncbi:MAG: hypothetical protein ABGX26_06795 [Nautiliaceae bacterium]